MDLHSNFSPPPLAIREDAARKLLSGWLERRGEAQRALDRLQSLRRSGADPETLRDASKACRAANEEQRQFEGTIAFSVLALLYVEKGESAEAALAIDGYLFIVESASDLGEPTVMYVIPPGAVVRPPEEPSPVARLFSPAAIVLAN